jgi:hypothetical protein
MELLLDKNALFFSLALHLSGEFPSCTRSILMWTALKLVFSNCLRKMQLVLTANQRDSEQN